MRCGGVLQMLLTAESVKVHNDVLSQVAQLRRMRRAKLTDDQTTQMCRVLDTLTGYCQAPNDPLHAHIVNQNIITSHC